jgi:hypothetical protein
MKDHEHAADCGCALPRKLPTIRIRRKVYYVDARLRQLRNVKDPHDYVDYGDELADVIAELTGKP